MITNKDIVAVAAINNIVARRPVTVMSQRAMQTNSDSQNAAVLTCERVAKICGGTGQDFGQRRTVGCTFKHFGADQSLRDNKGAIEAKFNTKRRCGQVGNQTHTTQDT